MENEVWKVYPFNSDYSVSSFGRVKVKDRISKDGRKFKGKILTKTLGSNGYRNVKINKKPRNVHQLVAEAFLGHKPCGYKFVVNHTDNNKLNNLVGNLEIVTARENTNRKHCKSSSVYTGVSWSNQIDKWKAQIQINGKIKYLGIFKCELAAADAYQTALKEL